MAYDYCPSESHPGDRAKATEDSTPGMDPSVPATLPWGLQVLATILIASTTHSIPDSAGPAALCTHTGAGTRLRATHL